MPASPLEALQFERNTLQARASALLQMDPATGAPIASATPPTAEEVTEATAINGQVRAIDARISAMESVREMQRTAPAAASARQSGGEALAAEPQIDPTAGFRNLADMAISVRRAVTRTGAADPRLDRIAAGYLQHGEIGAAPANYHQETNSDTGGWEVPPQFREEIFELAFSGTDIMSLLNMEPTTSNSIEMGKDESTPWGSIGIQAVWRVEAQQMSASKLATKGGRVELNELYAFVAATDELMGDAPRLNARLTRGAGRAIEWVGSEAFMWGDGVGKPKGWMNPKNDALVTISKESGQSGTIVTKNLGKMFARLYRGAGAKPMWFANSDILPQLLELTIGQVPIWTPAASGFKDAPSGNILGLPVWWTEHCPTLGTLGDIQIVDLAGMYAAMRAGGVQFAESMHLWFDYGLMAFRWTVRLAGQPLLSAPISPPAGKGSTTKSQFVTLEAR